MGRFSMFFILICLRDLSNLGRYSVMSFVGHEYSKERAVVPEEEDGHVDGMEDFVSPDGSDSEAGPDEEH